jgi:transposase
MFNRAGLEGLKGRKSDGRPTKVSRELVAQIYNEGPLEGSAWNASSFREAVLKQTGVLYAQDHLWSRILPGMRLR